MNVLLKCKCGALRGVVNDVSPSTGIHVVCTCDDCQAYAHFLGDPKDVLDEHGGTEVFQVTPSQLKITQGVEQIKLVRLKRKGLCRWYASCCNTPIANSLDSHKVPFVGIVHTVLDFAGDNIARDNALGPIRARNFGKFGIGKLPQEASQGISVSFVLRFVRFLLSGWIRKLYTPSPFFDSNTGTPIVAPYVLTTTERESLRQFCGPRA